MASNRIQYTIGFKADTTSAERAIKNLMAQLSKFQQGVALDGNLNPQLTKAVAAAEQLEIHLKKAYNVNTGKINFTALNNSLKSAGTSVTQLATSFANCGTAGEAALQSLARAVATMEIPLKRTNTLLASMMASLKNVAKYQLSMGILQGVQGAFSNSISYVKDLNGILNDIRIVTGQSADDMVKFAEAANKAAKELSVSTKDYAKASLIYYQQGDSAEEAAKKAAITTKAANVAFSASAQEMSEMLTAVWNSYQVGEDELERYVDIMAALGSKTATSTEEIAGAMQKVAATANVVGVSMEQMSSIIATVSSVTREAPESIGTSYKTILARIGDLKMGKTLDDGVTLGKVSGTLKQVGINVLDANKNLRDMGTIIEEIGEKWNTFTTAQQTAISQVVGGKRQYTQWLSLMDNWDTYLENLDIAKNADGTLEKQFGTYQDSWEAASKKMTASTEGLWSTLVPEKALISMTKSLADVVDKISEVAKGFGGLRGIIVQVAGALTMAFSNQIGASISGFTTRIKDFKNSFSGMVNAKGELASSKDKIRSFFTESTAQREYRTQNATLSNMLQQQSAGANPESYEVKQAEATQLLLNKRLELMANERNLTDAQKEAANSALNNLSQEIDKTEVLRQKTKEYQDEYQQAKSKATLNNAYYRDYRKSLQNLKNPPQDLSNKALRMQLSNQAGNLLNGNQTRMYKEQSYHTNYILSANQLFKQYNNNDPANAKGAGLDNLIERFGQLVGASKALSQVSSYFENFNNSITKGVKGSETQLDDLGQSLETLKTVIIKLGGNKDAIQPLINDFAKLREEAQNGKTIDFTSIITKLQEFLGLSNEGQYAISQFFRDLGLSQEPLNKVGSAADNLTTTLLQLFKQILNVNEGLGNLPIAGANAFQALAKGAATFTSSMSMSMSSFSNMIGSWDSMTNASKASSVAMASTNIISAIASLDPARIVGAVTGAAIGWVIGSEQAAEEAAKKIYEQAAKKVSKDYEQAQKNKEEFKNDSDLLKNYQTLYEDYMNGGDTTLEELQQAMLDVAEAYGVLDGSLAIATGNFKAFNKIVNETISTNNNLDTSFKEKQTSASMLTTLASTAKKSYTAGGDLVEQYVGNAGFYGQKLEKLYEETANNISTALKEIFNIDVSSTRIYDNLKHSKQNYGADSQREQLSEMLYGTGRNTTLWQFIRNFGYVDKELLTQENRQAFQEKMSSLEDFPFMTSSSKAFTLSHTNLNMNDQRFSNFNNKNFSSSLGESIFSRYDNLFAMSDNNVLGIAAPSENSSPDEIINWYNSLKELRQAINDIVVQNGVQLNDAELELVDILNTILSDDSQWTQAIQTHLINSELYNNVLMVSSLKDKIVGRNESNTIFSDYAEQIQFIMDFIDDHSEEDIFREQIKKYTDLGMTLEEAESKIATSMLNNYGVFDNYALIMQALVENFSGVQLQKAIQQIKNAGIKKISTLDENYISALKYALVDGTIDEEDSDILTKIQTANEKSYSSDKYGQFKTGLTYLKEDMELEDVNSLYKAFWDGSVENIMAWDNFIALSYDERKAYLERITKEQKENTELELQQSQKYYESVKKDWIDKLGGETGVSLAKIWEEVENAFSNELDTLLQQNEDGTYSMRDDVEDIVYQQAFGLKTEAIAGLRGSSASLELWKRQYQKNGLLQALSTSGFIDESGKISSILTDFLGLTNKADIDTVVWALMNRWGTEGSFDSTRAALEGLGYTEDQLQTLEESLKYWGLIASDAESAATQTERLVSAIKELPTNLDELEKIADALYGGHTDSNMEKLITSTSVERAKKVLEQLPQHIEMPTYTVQTPVKGVKSIYPRAYGVEDTEPGTKVVNDYAAYLQKITGISQEWAEAMSVLLSVDYSNITNYTSALNALTNAYSNFYQTGKLSTEAKSALTTLGLKPESIKDITDLDNAILDAEKLIDQAQTNITKQIEESNAAVIEDIKWDKTSTWDAFYENQTKEIQQVLDDETVKSVVQQYINQINSLQFLMDNFDSAAIKAGIDITNNIQAATNKVEELTTTAEKAKNAFEQLSSAFGKDENLSYTAQQMLGAAGLTDQYEQWQIGVGTAQGQAIAGKNNLGVLLSAGAMSLGAQVEALQAQQVKIDNFMATASKNHFFDTPLASSLNYMTSADLSLANERYSYIPNLAEFMLSANKNKKLTYDEDELNKVLNKYFADDAQMQKKIQEILKNHQGQDFSLQDLFAELQKYHNELDLDIQELVAGMNDSIEAALTTQIELEQAAAQEVLDIWQNTYDAIAAARKGVAEGGTIISSLYGNNDQLDAYIMNLLALGHSADDIKQILRGDTVVKDEENLRGKFDLREWGRANENPYVTAITEALTTEDSGFTEEKFQDLASKNYWGQQGTDDYKNTEIYKAMESYYDKMAQSLGQEAIANWNEEHKDDEQLQVKNTTDLVARQLDLLFGGMYDEKGELSSAWIDAMYKAVSAIIRQKEGQEYKKNYDLFTQQKSKYTTEAEEQDQTFSDLSSILDNLQQNGGQVDYDALSDDVKARWTSKQVSHLTEEGIQAQLQEIVKSRNDLIEKVINSFKDADLINEDGEITALGHSLGKPFSDLIQTMAGSSRVLYDNLQQIENGSVALKNYASAAGVSEDALYNYTQDLIANGQMLEQNTSLQYRYAAGLIKQNQGFTNVLTSLKNYQKELAKTKKGEFGYYSALSNIRKLYADVFGLSDKMAKKLSSGLLESTENANLLQKAAEGDNEAFKELLKLVNKDLTADLSFHMGQGSIEKFNSILEQIENTDLSDLQIGVSLEDQPFYSALAQMQFASRDAADAATAALSSVGMDAELQEVVVDSEGGIKYYNTSGQMVDENGKLIDVNAEARETITDVSQSYWVLKGANYNGKGLTRGGASKQTSGGGGSKAKKLDKKDPEDEIERYHHVNKTLDRLSNQLDEVDKKKSRIYGKSYLDYISQEIALTEKQCDTYQRYIDEAKEYLKLDTERVVSLGAIFDEYGNIANYDQVMQNILDAYNAFIDEYNAMDADTQQSEEVEQRKEDWDKWYDEKKKWIENYEETVQTIYEQNNNLLEAQNKISEKMLEGIQYKVEIHVELTDAEKEYLDYVNDKYEEILMKQGEAMSNLVKETDLTVSNLAALGKEKEELDAAFASGKLNQADYVDGLKDLNSQVLDNLSTLQELKTSIEEFYGDTLETATNDFDKQTAKVKAASEAMSSYISILALVGKGSNLKELTKFYDSQYQYNLQSLQMQQEYLNTLKKEEEYYLERMNSAEGLTETERKQYEALEETLNNVQSNILSDTQSTLQAIAEAFNNEVEIIISDLEKMIAGSDNSLQDLADAYSYYQEEQERYVTSARELYEVNKLNRSIEKTMATTTSTVNKNLLAALQERINKQSEENELTEYNVEMNQLQYELLLKKIALEEAQNAKNTVRLTRDAGGNYVYQYTANQEDILSKEQEYEDVLQQINDLSVNRVRDLESQLLQIYQNTTQKMREIAEDQTLTEEEKYAKIQTLMDQFKEQTNYIQEQYNIASAHLIKSNEVISEHYNKALVEHSQNAQNGLNQTIAKMIENTQQFQQAMEDACTNKIPSAMDQMKERIDSVTDTTNTSYGSMTDSLGNYNKVAEDAVDQNNKIADGLENEVLPAIHDITTAWDEYAAKLKEVINVYEEMYQTIVRTLQAQGKLSNAEELKSQVQNQGNSSSDQGLHTGTPGTKKSDAISPDGGGGGGGNDSTGSAGTKNDSTNANTLSITYKALVTTGISQGTSGGGVPIGPSTLKVGSSGTVRWNCADGYSQGGFEVSNPTLATMSGNTITALAAGSVVVTLKYWDRNQAPANTNTEYTSSIINAGIHQVESKKAKKAYGFATGGIADFTGPAWLDGTKSKPELVLNSGDTQNLLAAVESVRKLDSSTLRLLNNYIANASLAMTFGLSTMSAQSVFGGADTLRQDVHITAEFPNATNSQEIEDAFDSLINRAAQFITTKS